MKKILVCDESGLQRWALEKALNQLGYFVILAQNCNEAKQVVLQVKDIDLLITNIYAPIMKQDVMNLFQAHNRNGKIIFLSIFDEDEIVNLVSEPNKIEIMPKPFKIRSLNTKVGAMLR